MRGRERRWTDDGLRRAVAAHSNFTDVLRALGLRPAGGSHLTVKRYAARLKLDTSHLTDERRLRGLRASYGLRARPDSDVFCEQSAVTQHLLRRRARRALGPQVCALCDNTGWHNGRPLVLHLDHSNGMHNDNRIENLRWLCPNCHSQTSSYAGRKTRVEGDLRRVQSHPKRQSSPPVA